MSRALASRFSILTVAGFAAVAIIWSPLPNVEAQGGSPYSLLGKSAGEVAEAMIAQTRACGRLVQGTPEAVHTSSVSAAELPDLGLGIGPVVPPVPEPPMMLIVLRGEFDLSSELGANRLGAGTWHSRVAYLAYVVDLRAGAPYLMLTSVTGGRFRQILNDPRLPDDPPAGPHGSPGMAVRPYTQLRPVGSGVPYSTSPVPTVAPSARERFKAQGELRTR
jgi:hypothetical protein